MLTPMDRVWLTSSGLTAIFFKYVALAIPVNMRSWSITKHAAAIKNATFSGKNKREKPYPAHTNTRRNASAIRMRLSPNISIALPRMGLKNIPITPPTVIRVATIAVLLLKTVTRTHGAKVRNICFRVPKRMQSQ